MVVRNPAVLQDPTYRFTVDQYRRMISAGILDEGDGIELVDGQVVYKGRRRNGVPVAYRFSAEQYRRMSEAGILTEDDSVELLEGAIVPQMARNPPHDSTMDRLEDLIRELLPAGWRPRGQKAIDLVPNTPEPDIAVVLGPASRYDDHHPGPSEIAFVVEVSDTQLYKDQTTKVRVYAQAGIPVYWIVNLEAREIEVYTDPTSPPAAESYYASRTDYAPGQRVPVVVAGQTIGTIAVTDVLPPAQ